VSLPSSQDRRGAAGDGRSAAGRRRRRTSLSEATVNYGILLLATAFCLLPILWGLSTSLKTLGDINAYPPRWIPSSLHLGNYAEVFQTPKFVRYLLNSVVVLVATLAVSLGAAAHAAYGASRFTFYGKTPLMLLMWSTVMIPGVAVIVPIYLLSVKLSLYDTYTVLVLVYASWVVPTLIWLLKGFIDSVPSELDEAALIDGCSRLGAFYRVILPLMRPGLVAGAVLTIMMVWNDFIIGYSVTLTDPHRMVQVGLYLFITEFGISWGPLMAATMTALAPVVAAFAFMQRALIQGMTGGSVRG
jgi:ABC-type glycerol-3-phosphate transport system permease component